MIIAKRPVDDIMRQYIAIGDDYFRPFFSKQGTAADTYFLNPASFIPDINGIANPEWPVEDQDHAGYKIIYNALQAEAYTDSQSPENNRNPVNSQSRCGNGKQEAGR